MNTMEQQDTRSTSMTLNDLEQKYGKSPDNLDRTKLTALLKKRDCQYALIDNLRKRVVSFLNEFGIEFAEEKLSIPNLKGEDETLKLIKLENKLTLVLVDNYISFNKRNVPKDTASKVHKQLTENGSRVIWIKKFEWENTNKQNVLKSLILHCLGKTPNKIYARNTICDVIENSELRDFFNQSSFYGFRSADTAVCLRDKKTGEVLQAMSFGHPYYGKQKYGEGAVECIRSAGKPFTLISGGMTKLMGYYIDRFGDEFDTIVYYVDDAHHQSGSMEALGFEYSHFTGAGVHNVWQYTGAMFMRTPSLHSEIMYLQKLGEIYGVPDVGNSIYVYKKGKQVGHTSE